MRVLFVCDYFPPFIPGGAEWSIYYLAKALTKKGHQVTILTPNYGQLSSKEKKEGFKVMRYPFPIKLKSSQRILPYLFHNQPLYYLYSAFSIIRACLGERPAVIHVQSRFSLPGSILAKLVLRIPVIFNVRNPILFCPTGVCLHQREVSREFISFSHFWQKCSRKFTQIYIKPKNKLFSFYTRLNLCYLWFDNFFKRQMLKLCDRIIFISQGLMSLFLLGELVRQDKAAVIYNLPPLEFKIPSRKDVSGLKKKYNLGNKKIVLFASRLTLGKGVYDLLKAAEIVINKDKKAVFLLLGKIKPEFFQHKRVIIVPAVSHQRLFTFYQLADMVVIPSRYFEGLGRIPQEVALFKKPVVVTNAGGLPEQIVDKKTGFVVPKGEPAKLAEAILRLLTDDKLRIVMGEKHEAFIKKKFNEEKIVNKLIFIYESVLR